MHITPFMKFFFCNSEDYIHFSSISTINTREIPGVKSKKKAILRLIILIQVSAMEAICPPIGNMTVRDYTATINAETSNVLRNVRRNTILQYIDEA